MGYGANDMICYLKIHVDTIIVGVPLRLGHVARAAEDDCNARLPMLPARVEAHLHSRLTLLQARLLLRYVDFVVANKVQCRAQVSHVWERHLRRGGGGGRPWRILDKKQYEHTCNRTK